MKKTVGGDYAEIRLEIKDIKHRLNTLEKQYGHLKSVAKKIDSLHIRVKVIEKHLKVKA